MHSFYYGQCRSRRCWSLCLEPSPNMPVHSYDTIQPHGVKEVGNYRIGGRTWKRSWTPFSASPCAAHCACSAVPATAMQEVRAPTLLSWRGTYLLFCADIVLALWQQMLFFIVCLRCRAGGGAGGGGQQHQRALRHQVLPLFRYFHPFVTRKCRVTHPQHALFIGSGYIFLAEDSRW